MEKFSDSDFEFLANIQNKKLLKKKRERIEPVLKDVRSFLKSRGIVLYGGFALNTYLTEKDKIYDAKLDIPDYDGYSNEALKAAIDLFDHLVAKGYKILLLKEAIHDGTYNISWEFNSIVDITQVNDDFYAKVMRSKRLVDGVYVIDPNLLKANAYIEFAAPESSMYRWGKMMPRVKKLEKAVPLMDNELKRRDIKPNNKIPVLADWDLPPLIRKLYIHLWNYAVDKGLPLLGSHAVAFHMRKRGKASPVFPPFRVSCFAILETLAKDSQSVLKGIRSVVGRAAYDAITLQTEDNVATVTYKGRKYEMFRVHDVSEVCISVSKASGGEKSASPEPAYGSLFYLVYQLYFKLFEMNSLTSCRKSAPQSVALQREIKATIEQLLSRVNRKQFGIECYGYFKSITVIKKERYVAKTKQVIKSDR